MTVAVYAKCFRQIDGNYEFVKYGNSSLKKFMQKRIANMNAHTFSRRFKLTHKIALCYSKLYLKFAMKPPKMTLFNYTIAVVYNDHILLLPLRTSVVVIAVGWLKVKPPRA